MRFSALIIVLFVSCFIVTAQDLRSHYDEFRESARREYDSFAVDAKKEFLKALGEPWKAVTVYEPNNRQVSTPIAKNSSELLDNATSAWFSWGKTDDCVNTRNVSFDYYSNDVVVKIPGELGTFHPKDITEHQVAYFWRKLDNIDYSCLLTSLSNEIARNKYNGWSVYKWVVALSEAVFPENIACEREVFTVFLMSKVGYMTQIARNGESLIVLFASERTVYSRKYIVIDTYPYYVAERSVDVKQLYTYSTTYDNLSPLVLDIKAGFNLHGDRSVYSDFYEDYPQVDLDVYARAPISMDLLDELKGRFARSHSDFETVNSVLKYVQDNFAYETDIVQFGYEKTFFAEENYRYPYNDCEDRSILFSQIVSYILGYDVILLEYPDHVAAAVRIEDDTALGSYVKVGKDRYYICDPSYLGSSVGDIMPAYIKKSVKIWKVKSHLL